MSEYEHGRNARRLTVAFITLALVLVAGCWRDSEPVGGQSSANGASVFRNLGKR